MHYIITEMPKAALYITFDLKTSNYTVFFCPFKRYYSLLLVHVDYITLRHRLLITSNGHNKPILSHVFMSLCTHLVCCVLFVS